MPDTLLFLPEDRDMVFSNLGDFYAHHTGMTKDDADISVTHGFIAWCMDNEMTEAQKQGSIQIVRKEDKK